MTNAELLAHLEAISRGRADRVLRLGGSLPVDGGGSEPFELLIFRGFSSSVSHPLLPEGATIETAELLRGPLNPTAEERLAEPSAPETFLDPLAWR
ncbi:MAG: hypothetical protein MUD04_02305 [Cyanobium sp. Prado107]|nr:hypothetical protein [Cyanobium sp. Prado107]